MHRRRLLWELFPTYLLIVVLSLVVAGWYAAAALRRSHLDDRAGELKAIAQLARELVRDRLPVADAAVIEPVCREVAQAASSRITIILPTGRVVGDSEEDPAAMDNHADRPEVIAALSGGVGTAIRHSYTLGQDMMYVAVPVERDGRVVGVARAAVSLQSIDAALANVRRRVIASGLIIGLFAAAVSLVVARRISRHLEDVQLAARRFAEGNFEHKLSGHRIEELAQLSESLNSMAAQLDERIRSLVEQRNERHAVLSSMVEGVVAVDRDERVLTINLAAGRLLAVATGGVEGRLIQEVVRNPELHQFIERTFGSTQPVEGDIVLLTDEAVGEGRRFLQVHGTLLRDAHGESIGAVVVLNDVTRLRRLENLRREFVANVSHELKTPITSIKGFVETLLDGAIEQPEDARRFLGIIARHADRLHSIVEDLLSLSRIEQGVERGEIPLESNPVRPSVQAAIQACQMRADEKNITVRLNVAEDVRAWTNPPLLEQAVVNLVDNAIKYSEPDKQVLVEAAATGGEVYLIVKDEGCGIEAEHLDRIFERFYRVDSGRSRSLGGTGLGLAIVKHIAQAHGGRVSVESTPGQGSTFTIHLRAGIASEAAFGQGNRRR